MNTLTAIATRKSIRAYSPRQLEERDVEVILGAGSSAPVALGDYGNVHFTVIQHSGMLASLAGEPGGFYGAPTLVMLSARETPYPNIEYFNTGCILENMLLAATALGLGGVFISGASEAAKASPELLARLGLPEGYLPVAAVALGYPETQPKESKAFKNKVTINRLP